MEPQTMIVAIVAIGCITGLISKWMNSKKGHSDVDSESFNRLARAFMEHKKEMQKRVENLEAIIADEESKNDFLEIENQDSKGALTNDLDKKDKVRS